MSESVRLTPSEPVPVVPTTRHGGQPAPRSAWWRTAPGPGWIATATWAVGSASAAVLVRVLDLNPLTSRGVLLPLVVGMVGLLVFAALLLRRLSDRLVGCAAGCAAAWVMLTLLASYNGTPFGESGLRGDTARLTAAITRYTVTWHPVDAFVPSVPTEYPPLFPWLIARFSLVVHQPGWTLLGDAEALIMSLGVLVGFLLWRRLLTAAAALVLAFLPVFVFGQPRKSYEVFVLCLFTPWALATFSRFRLPGGLHWLPAGVLLGIFLQTYQGYVLFDVVGLLVLALLGLRTAAPRWAYVWHLLGVAVTAFVVAAWYLVPYLYGVLVLGGPRVNDFYVAAEIKDDPLGIGMFTASWDGPLRLFGLLGLVALQKRQWWARSLLVLVVGAYLYRVTYLLVFVGTGHTGYLDYTSRLLGTLLMSAFVLTVVAVVPLLQSRVSLSGTVPVLTVGAVLLVGLTMTTDWRLWMPMPAGLADDTNRPVDELPNLAAIGHSEKLPNGLLPRYHPPELGVSGLPVSQISSLVASRFGKGSRPVTLSYSEKLFAYEPWTAYIAVERLASNTFARFDARRASVAALARVTDPQQFATATKTAPFGGIDVFVLHNDTAVWTWADIPFSPAQFDPRFWQVTILPQRTVLAIRIANLGRP